MMKHLKTTSHRGKFDLLTDTRLAQAAMMTLRPGQSSEEQPANEHPRCEQWLFVLRGVGRAIVGKTGKTRSQPLRAGSLLVIERGEAHQITCTGRVPLKTLNLYVPPA